jgi:hypothetical protein
MLVFHCRMARNRNQFQFVSELGLGDVHFPLLDIADAFLLLFKSQGVIYIEVSTGLGQIMMRCNRVTKSSR